MGGTRPSALWLATAFAAGFLAVLVFQQGAVGLLHAAGLAPNPPFPRRPTWPFAIPQIWSWAFWGGVWGIALALVLPVVARPSFRWYVAFLFGALGPTLVGWFIVAPLRGAQAAGGWQFPAMARGLFLNGVWGLGTAVLCDAARRWMGR